MRQIPLITIVLLFFFTFSCKPKSISGVYSCDQSIKKPTRNVNQTNKTEVFLDVTCTITSFEFKGNSIVSIKLANEDVVSS